MPTAEKVQKVQEITALFKGHSDLILADYRGLTVADITELRRKLSSDQTTFRVLKNTLVKRAASEAGIEGLDEHLQGPIAIAFCGGDITTAAKALNDFGKDSEKLEIRAGLLDGKVIDAGQVVVLAKLPSRDELLAKLVGSLNSPLSGLVRVLNGPPQSLATVLGQIVKQKEEAA